LKKYQTNQVDGPTYLSNFVLFWLCIAGIFFFRYIQSSIESSKRGTYQEYIQRAEAQARAEAKANERH
jgi:hypothetical protein